MSIPVEAFVNRLPNVESAKTGLKKIVGQFRPAIIEEMRIQIRVAQIFSELQGENTAATGRNDLQPYGPYLSDLSATQHPEVVDVTTNEVIVFPSFLGSTARGTLPEK